MTAKKAKLVLFIWLTLCLLLFMASFASAQVMNRPLTVLRTINLMPMGTTVPATCSVNQFFGETDTLILWLCTSTDTWEAVGSMNPASNETVTGDWSFQGLLSIGNGTDQDTKVDVDLATGDFSYGWDEADGRFEIPVNLTVGTPVDEDSLIFFNTATGGTLRFGLSVGLGNVFFADRELYLPDDRGIQFNSSSGGVNDTTEFGWHGGTDRFVFTDVGGAGNGFSGSMYPDLPPQNLPPTCQAGHSGLDTGGLTVEFCICRVADTWDCIDVTTTGGPKD
jgi:hypothetical protein